MDMKIIGITGGVGCGKSRVLQFIKENYNCQIILADDVGFEVEKKGEDCYKQIVETFGTEILGPDGELDRKKLASIVFADEEKTKQINSIIHPAVIARIHEKEELARLKGEIDFFFIEAALLIECGFNSYVDEMWYIYSDMSVRKERLKSARGYTDELIDKIMSSQLSEAEFRANSDFVVDNSGDINDTCEQIRTHMKGLM